ncbi:MAG: hypothetical protein HFJ09_06845 [Lachnospiraceae bacterium]|nr:hypothetical protein [Lachnospiraceae bacterium]
MIGHPVETATGIGHAVTHPKELLNGLKEQYWGSRKNWTQKVSGVTEAVCDIAFLLYGAKKGFDKLSKGAKARKAAKIAESGETAGEAVKIGEEAAKVVEEGAAGGKGEVRIESGKISRVGDFTDLEGSTVDEILDRIPDEAILRELKPVVDGATEGFEFKWKQNNQTYRVRVHNQDPSAPVGSNAYNGWIVRIRRGRQFYDYTINDFREAKYTNPTGNYFDEAIMNNTHIPIKDPYK